MLVGKATWIVKTTALPTACCLATLMLPLLTNTIEQPMLLMRSHPSCLRLQPGQLAAITSSTPLELQEWMVGQLNSLPWTKIDIDCRHMHSHAGIVVRIPDRYPVKDGVHYLVEQIVWD